MESTNLIFQCANKLAECYLFIGARKAKEANNFVAQSRLYLAIVLYKLSYKFDRKNGALFLVAKCYQSLGNFDINK